MKDLGIRSARVRVEMEFFRTGSVLRSTVQSGCKEVRTHFEVESDEPEQAILEAIRLAKRGCYAENMVQTAVPLKSTYSLNGKEIAISLADR
jgi:uncharacterized OsmC-like protein